MMKHKTTPRLQWLLLFMVAMAVICSNLHGMLTLDEKGVAAANHKYRTSNAIKLLLTPTTNATTLVGSSIDNDGSSIGSFFDCNGNQSKCRYFYPGEFFRQYFLLAAATTTTKHDNSNISGSDVSRNFTGIAFDQQIIELRKQIGLENLNLPALDSLSWWLDGGGGGGGNKDMIMNIIPTKNHDSAADFSHQFHNQIQNHINLPNNITYIHVHKCGGTSIQGALYRRARHIRNTHFQITNMNNNDTNTTEQPLLPLNLQANVHTYKHSFGGGSKEKKAQWDKERLSHIQAIAEMQQQSTVDPVVSAAATFPIFTIVRDPIERFLSAIQQVMHYNIHFREKCLNEDTMSLVSSILSKSSKEEREAPLRRQTIQCAIQDMIETTYRRDVHLLPIASHFRLLNNVTMGEEEKEGRDIAVSVFHMQDIEDVLLHLGNKDNRDDDNSDYSKSTTIHARDRSNVEYATSSILAKLSSKDCDEGMIKQICGLYHVDVALMKWLRFQGESVERC
ncbi:hypothetical protein ACHAXR_003326, partial [Thalassiosira sp. AJA248-18]